MKMFSFLFVISFALPSLSANLGEQCEKHSDCRQEPHPLANCHPVTRRCMCGPREKLGQDGNSCVDRREPGVIIVNTDEKAMASPKHMPLDASKRFQQMMIESAVKRALDKQSLAEVMRRESGDAVRRIIKVAIHNSKLAHKHNYEAVLEALKATLKEDEVPEEAIEEAVMEAIKEEEGKHRMISMEMSREVSLCLLVTGLLMVAASLTFLYVKKIRETRRLKVLSNRLENYAVGDQRNFVAEQMEKSEHVLDPKFLTPNKQ